MNKDKYIFISGPEEQKMKEAVQTLADHYEDTEFVKGITIYKSSANTYVINFKNTPDFERFKYFVNYLNYPDIKDSKFYNAKVAGYWTIGENDDLNNHRNERILLYVSDDDTEGDNVFALFQNSQKLIKLGFALGYEYKELPKSEFDFLEPEIKESDYNLFTTIYPVSTSKSTSRPGCLGVIALFLAVTMALTLLLL